MTSRDFAFWLQGFLEVSGQKTITEEQTGCIKKHLNLVFEHEIDPSQGNPDHQNLLNHLHNGPGKDLKVRC